jgi:hypothetical protein
MSGMISEPGTRGFRADHINISPLSPGSRRFDQPIYQPGKPPTSAKGLRKRHQVWGCCLKQNDSVALHLSEKGVFQPPSAFELTACPDQHVDRAIDFPQKQPQIRHPTQRRRLIAPLDHQQQVDIAVYLVAIGGKRAE